MFIVCTFSISLFCAKGAQISFCDEIFFQNKPHKRKTCSKIPSKSFCALYYRRIILFWSLEMAQCIGGEIQDPFSQDFNIRTSQGKPITAFIDDKTVLIEIFLTWFSHLGNWANILEFYINSVTWFCKNRKVLGWSHGGVNFFSNYESYLLFNSVVKTISRWKK